MHNALKYLVAVGVTAAATVAAAVAASSSAHTAAADKYTVKVPGGLEFSEFKGYESWPVIAVSENKGLIAAIVGNPVTIKAYGDGVPGNGTPFPDGAKIAKIHWKPKTQEAEPGQPTVPGTQHDVDFMVKDSKRFADSGGWGYAYFIYDASSGTFSPATTADKPPQANDARCGVACHTVAKTKDYVFTDYGTR